MSTTLNYGLNRLRHVIREPWSSLGSYSTGTIAVANAGTTVTGSSTVWLTNAKAGDTIYLPDTRYYHVLSIASDTSLTITPAYAGTTVASAGVYVISGGRNTTATLVDELNAAHREIAAEVGKLDENYMAVTGTISYNNTEQYDFPTTNGVVKKILLVQRTDLSTVKTLTPINFQNRGDYLLETGQEAGDLPEYYYILGMKIGIVPIPTVVKTNNITITYIPEATDMTLGTGTIILPDDLRDLWVYAAAISLTDDPAVAQKYMALRSIMLSTLGPRQLQEGRTVNYKDEDFY